MSMTPLSFVRKFGTITGDTWREFRTADGRKVEVRTDISRFYFPLSPQTAKSRLTNEQARLRARNMLAGQDRRRAERARAADASTQQRARGRSR